jgi:hypothetical protein
VSVTRDRHVSTLTQVNGVKGYAGPHSQWLIGGGHPCHVGRPAAERRRAQNTAETRVAGGNRPQTTKLDAAGCVRTRRRRRVERYQRKRLERPELAGNELEAVAGTRVSSETRLRRAKLITRGGYGIYSKRGMQRALALDQKLTGDTPATCASGGAFGRRGRSS